MKKILLVICTICLIIGFSGCGKKENNWELRSVTIDDNTMNNINGHEVKGEITFIDETKAELSAYLDGEMIFDEMFEYKVSTEDTSTFYTFSNDDWYLFGLYFDDTYSENLWLSSFFPDFRVVFLKEKK